MLLRWILALLSVAYTVLAASLGAVTSKVYEPNPPVTHRVLMTFQYTDNDSKELKQHDVTIELYGTVVPQTVQNFVALARGVKARIKGGDENDIKFLAYKDTIFHRIVPDFMMQGGDVIPEVGPFSIFGAKFPDESFFLKHDRPGRLSMANSGPDSNASQFFITTRVDPLEDLDNKHVCFGQVVHGLEEVIDKIQRVETGAHDKPLNDVSILYVIVDELQLGNKDELHKQYLGEVEKFRNGDQSVGVTMQATFDKGAQDEKILEEALYAKYHHPLLKVLLGMSALVLLYIAAKYRKSFLPKTSNVVSLRHE